MRCSTCLFVFICFHLFPLSPTDYQNNGNIGHNGPASTSYADAFISGDVIGVEVQVDGTTFTIDFFKNGINLGRAFQATRHGPLYAAVSLWRAGDSFVVLPGLDSAFIPRLPHLQNTRVLNPMRRGSAIVIGATCRTVTKRTRGWDDGIAMAWDPITSGSRSWTFRILSGSRITIGIVDVRVPLIGYLNMVCYS